MLGFVHLLIALICAISISIGMLVFGVANVFQIILFVLGALIGALIPDIDAAKSKILNFRNPFLAFFGVFTKIFIYFPVAFVSFVSRSTASLHRGFFHSLGGIVITSAFWFGLFYSFFYILKLEAMLLPFLIWFSIGMLFGAFLHLLYDAMTREGIRFFAVSIRKTIGDLNSSSVAVPIVVAALCSGFSLFGLLVSFNMQIILFAIFNAIALIIFTR